MTGIAQIGEVLAGKYRVDKILGVGGMGMVVAATHLDLDHRVALKFMLPEALESVEASNRFLREARASSALSSEHICRVTDLGKLDNGAPYIVMEYLEGFDLQSLLTRRGALPVATAVDYVLQVCEGMAEAHMHGIVHRDLKPGNLFVTRRADGSPLVKVLDFGISKAAFGGIVATHTGDVMGSPAYMAPEQMESAKEVDQRADIWSLGVILYQLVTGHMPFQADTLPALCMCVLSDPPEPLDALRADLPPGFADAVMRALEKDRLRRYQDVGELASAFGQFGSDTAVQSVTRIWGVLHPTERSSQPSFPNTDIVPTFLSTEAMKRAVSRKPPPASATLSEGAAESMYRMRWLRMRSYGWLGVAVLAAGVVVLVIMMKSGRDAHGAAGQSAPSVPVLPSPSPVPPPARETVAPVLPPDPSVHIEDPVSVDLPARVDSHHSKQVNTTKKKADTAPKQGSAVGSGTADGSGDDPWTHMQHDTPK
jgi:serine/threonine protein kinase